MDYGQPAHTEGLVRELQSCTDVRATLLRAVRLLPSDSALMTAFLSLSFDPETSDFITPPSRIQAIAAISAEYDVHTERSQAQDSHLRQAMNRTYLELGLGSLAVIPGLGTSSDYLLTDLWGTPKKEDITATPQTISTRPSRFATPVSWTSEPEDTNTRGLRHLSALLRTVLMSHPAVHHKEVITLVLEETARVAGGMREREEKNVKRRLYDAINVLLAVGVVVKEGPLLKWKGCAALRPAEIHTKQETLTDLVSRYIAIRHLLLRNSTEQLPKDISLPFLLAATPDSVENSVCIT